MSIAIQIKNLSKKYPLYTESQGQDTFVDTLSSLFKFKWKRKKEQDFWALKDVSFEIHQGDKLGIMGKNGAGKSTLLKLLSRITKPTKGQIKIFGRVSSLLEVGTGFHPELTGRENIFLNGAILGLKNQQIRKHFDEIVAFSEIESFLDTPVKRYSSGMLTRLGFAVAAHLKPDILIIDEVLAVGDYQFQNKCLKKLDTFGKEGKTIIFVSHDLVGLNQLCNKGLFLENGVIKKWGDFNGCLNEYLKNYAQYSHKWEGNEGDEHIRFYRVSLSSLENKNCYFLHNEKIQLSMELELLKTSPQLIFGIGIYNQRNQLLAVSEKICDTKKRGLFHVLFPIDTNLFHQGEYFLKVLSRLHSVKPITTDEITLKFSIYSDGEKEGSSMRTTEGLFLGNHWTLNHDYTKTHSRFKFGQCESPRTKMV